MLGKFRDWITHVEVTFTVPQPPRRPTPILAMTVAVHSTAKVGWRNGAQADAAEGEVGPAMVLIEVPRGACRVPLNGAYL